MKKEKFLMSTIILIIGGAITKVLGMVIRIVMTRLVGTDGIGLYMLIFPTFSLFMTLSQLGFPIAISKLVSEDIHNNKKIVFSVIPFSIILNIILIIIILIIAPTLSFNLLKDPRCYYPILAIAVVLPFDSLSSILRGYFFGKQKMFPHVCSNISEQIIRLVLIILLVPKILEVNLIYAVAFLVAVNMVSEFLSIFVLFLFLPKNFKIKSSDIVPDLSNIKDVLRISIPTTGSRLIGSIGYFFEPIIITTSATLAGLNINYIISQYGLIEGCIMPLLMLPSFFSNAISSALLPVISKAYAHNKKEYVKKKIKQAIIISLAIGIPITAILMIFPTFFLKLIYNTTQGVSYLRLIAPFLLIYYIQAPLSIVLQSINKSKYVMIDNTKGIIIRSITMFVGGYFLGIYGFLIAMCTNILIVTYLHYKHIKKAIF